MEVWLKLSRKIDAMNRYVGMIASWCILILVLVGAANAIVRYVSGIEVHTGWRQYLSFFQRIALTTMQAGGNSFLEIQMYLFAAVFMLGSAYVLRRNEHVRVDLIYGNMSRKGKLYIDIFGYIFFFMPVMFFVLKYAIPFFWSSFQNQETSSNAAGLILWPVKALLPISYIMLTFQGISEFIKRIAALKGYNTDDATYEKPAQ